MAHQWTAEDQEDWDYLNEKSYSDRAVNEEMRFEQLTSLRELRVMEKKEAMRKAGPLRKPALVCLLLSVGSCLGGGIGLRNNVDGTGWFFAIGIVLLLVSGGLNTLNDKITGQDD